MKASINSVKTLSLADRSKVKDTSAQRTLEPDWCAIYIPPPQSELFLVSTQYMCWVEMVGGGFCHNLV